MHTAHVCTDQPAEPMTLVQRLNGPRHELALRVFLVIVLAHWAEHLLQALQIYALGWPVPEARGLLAISIRGSSPPSSSITDTP
jgi:hypothetical protein